MSDLRQRLYLTIITKRGSKQYNLNKLLQRFAIYLVLALVVLIFIGFFTMRYLMDRLEDITYAKDKTLFSYNALLSRNSDLKSTIDKKTKELLAMNEKIDELEEVIDLTRNKDIKKTYVDMEALNANQKELFLKLLPSYYPLPLDMVVSATPTLPILNKNSRIKIQNQNAMKFALASYTPIYATADGIVEVINHSKTSRFGKYVKIIHAFGFTSLYAHLATISTSKTRIVKKGDVIGYADHSLYYEVRFISRLLDTSAFIKWNLEDFNSAFVDETINWQSLLTMLNGIIALQTYRLNSSTTQIPTIGEIYAK